MKRIILLNINESVLFMKKSLNYIAEINWEIFILIEHFIVTSVINFNVFFQFLFILPNCSSYDAYIVSINIIFLFYIYIFSHILCSKYIVFSIILNESIIDSYKNNKRTSKFIINIYTLCNIQLCQYLIFSSS